MIVEINGVEWRLYFVGPDDPVLIMGDSYTYGVTNIYDRCIYISNDLDDSLLYDVLVHELTHATNYSLGFNISIPCDEVVSQVVERHSDDIQELANEVYMNL